MLKARSMGSFCLAFSAIHGAYVWNSSGGAIYHINPRFLEEFLISVVLERVSV